MFKSLMAIVAIAFAVAACDQSPQAASPAPPPAPLPMKYWMVFFDTNSATLNDKACVDRGGGRRDRQGDGRIRR